MPQTYIRHGRKPQHDRIIKFELPAWVDPYYWIQGSVPEKMVMAEFVRRGIYFQHTPQKNELGGAVDPTWEADFWLPQYKIWIEVNGLYFHTKPGAPEADAYRYAALEAAGVKVIVLWDYDIEDHLIDLLNQYPEFTYVEKKKQQGHKTNHGLPFYEGGDGIDHLAGLRTALRRRAVAGNSYIGIKRYRTKRRAK